MISTAALTSCQDCSPTSCSLRLVSVSESRSLQHGVTARESTHHWPAAAAKTWIASGVGPAHAAPAVVHELTQTDLAQLVGTDRASVNRALQDFMSRGWILVDDKSALIIDPDALARRAKFQHRIGRAREPPPPPPPAPHHRISHGHQTREHGPRTKQHQHLVCGYARGKPHTHPDGLVLRSPRLGRAQGWR